MQAMAWLACICVGVHRMTASTSGSASESASSVETCLMPNAPAPASATLMVPAMSVVLQDQVADRRVAGRHMVEAVPHRRLPAAVDVAHRAARDQPHHEFDALAAGLAHIVDMRHFR